MTTSLAIGKNWLSRPKPAHTEMIPSEKSAYLSHNLTQKSTGGEGAKFVR